MTRTRPLNKTITLDLTSKNLSRAFREGEIGAVEAVKDLRELRRIAYLLIASEDKGERTKGTLLLRWVYERFEAFVKHTEGSKLDLTDKANVESLSGEQLEKLLSDIQIGQ